MAIAPLSTIKGNTVLATGEQNRVLTRAEFFGLTDLPAENEWFAHLDNPHTRRAYEADMKDFMAFTGVDKPIEFRIVQRGHVIVWRKSIEERERSAATIWRKLAKAA